MGMLGLPEFVEEITAGNNIILTEDPAGSGKYTISALVGLSGLTYYYSNDASVEVPAYNYLYPLPQDDTEQDYTATLTDSGTEYIVDEFITNGGFSANHIPAGIWTFHSYAYRSGGSNASDVTLIYRVFKRDSGGTETELFNVESAEVDAEVTYATIETEYTITEEINIDLTDNIVVKVYGKRVGGGGAPTVHVGVGGDTNASHVETTLAFARITIDDVIGLRSALSEFVAGTFTPTVGLCPRVVPQYDWPVDNYTILIAWTPDPADATGDIILDMTTGTGSSTLGLRVEMAGTDARILYFLGPTSIRSANIDISSAITNGYEVRIALRRDGSTADYSYQINGGAETSGAYGGTATFVDIEWPETAGLASDRDGTTQIKNPLTDFRAVNGQWYLDIVGQDIDDQIPPTVVFDGREIYENQTNIALIADSDLPSHGLYRGDIAFFYGGILHSVIRSGLYGAGVDFQSGTNADGSWKIWYDSRDGIVRVEQVVITGNNDNVPLPIEMPDENYSVFVGGHETVITLNQTASAWLGTNKTTTSFKAQLFRSSDGVRISGAEARFVAVWSKY